MATWRNEKKRRLLQWGGGEGGPRKKHEAADILRQQNQFKRKISFMYIEKIRILFAPELSATLKSVPGNFNVLRPTVCDKNHRQVNWNLDSGPVKIKTAVKSLRLVSEV
jgi:hypothetical protein